MAAPAGLSERSVRSRFGPRQRQEPEATAGPEATEPEAGAAEPGPEG